MKLIKLISIFSLIILSSGCTFLTKITNKSYNGEYVAVVSATNTESGISSAYKLKVKTVENELVKICWISGGYKDVSQFNPSSINKKGYCEFTSDKGYKYKVQIKGHTISPDNRDIFDNDMDDEDGNNYYFYSDDEEWDEHPVIE